MLGTGLRVGETTGLRWDDVDLKEGIVNVNHTLVYYNQPDIRYLRNWRRTWEIDMFGKKKIRELDALFESLAMNGSNNYKDAAKKDYEDICSRIREYQASGEYSEKILKPYVDRMQELAPSMENYNHQNNVKSF